MLHSTDNRDADVPSVTAARGLLLKIYGVLNDYYGDLHWWPGESPFEVVVGAILTQNTSWKNVERAIDRLKAVDMLTPAGLWSANEPHVAELIRPAGYYRLKTKRLKAFLEFLYREYGGDLDALFQGTTERVRGQLLSVYGIGEETADSILLYAGGKPIFVVDAYTRRIMQRHRLIDGNLRYAEIQALFMTSLSGSASLYNQYHALLVNVGKHFCGKQKPKCCICPLRLLLNVSRETC